MTDDRTSLSYFSARFLATGISQALGAVAEFGGWNAENKALLIEGARYCLAWRRALAIPKEDRSQAHTRHILDYEGFLTEHGAHLREISTQWQHLLDEAERITAIACPIILEASKHGHVIAPRFDPFEVSRLATDNRRRHQALFPDRTG